ncbi:hypothetical protein E2C01_099806 [Portunus trituberculatus]|uniref:Uncharacterized protein n=1 Tax=Portunus trituberculatus TaxID=210409 RepID=A0A5B7K6G6_PORTR|nr:hypothetical protein [Portunus trituberculatus]
MKIGDKEEQKRWLRMRWPRNHPDEVLPRLPACAAHSPEGKVEVKYSSVGRLRGGEGGRKWDVTCVFVRGDGVVVYVLCLCFAVLFSVFLSDL